MVSPIDYTFGGTLSPFQALAQGAQMGAQFGTLQAQRQAAEQQAALAQSRAAAQTQITEQARLRQQALAELYANPNPTARDFVRVASMLPEKDAASLRAGFEVLDKERRSSTLLFGGQVMSALQSPQPEIGITLLRERAAAERNAGRADQAQAFETYAKLAEIDPKAVFTQMGTLLSTLGEEGQKAVESLTKVGEEQRKAQLFGPQYRTAVAAADKGEADAKAAGVAAEFARPLALANLGEAQAKAITAASDANFRDRLNQAGLDEKNWNVRNVQNQINIRGQQLGLDREKVGSEVALNLARVAELATSLPEQAKKDINTAAVTAGTAKQQSIQFNSLASKLEKEGGGYGALSRFAEWAAKNTGREDYMTQLRQEFTRLRNSAAVQSLPPGPATDRDIALVLEGFPAASADTRVMASFLRGMAKLQDITSATENARVDWLSQNRGSLGRARSEFKAGDFMAVPGETWVDLSQRIAADVASRYATGGAPGAPIPTTMPPAPAAPAMPPGFRLITPPR